MRAIFNRGKPPPCPSPFNLAAYVLAAGQATPDKIALSVLSLSGARRWSFASLTRAVQGTATGLGQSGARPGDRILMRLGNTAEFPITYLAALAADLIPVPTSALLTAPEIARIAAEITPALIVADEGLSLPNPVPAPVILAADLAAMHDLPPTDFAMGDPERPGYIIYTSGTAGTPRAVTHAHRAIWARRLMWDGWYGLTDADRLLHAGAFNWTYTLGTGLLDPWTRGATALIPGPGITPAHLPLLLKRHDASLFAAAPGVYRQLLRHPIPDLPKLRHGLSAGEKLPAVTRRNWQGQTGTPVHEAYGMSECSTFVSGSPANPAPEATLGHPQTGRKVAVMGPEGPVAFGEPGTLAVSTGDPGLMLGYWNSTRGAPKRPGGDWFGTGDTVSMAEDGAITYLGRGDDMMNAGGVRVSPIEVESVLNAHPEIHECAAIELRLKADTSVIAAYYVAEHELDPAGLDHFAATLLARYKCPRIYTRIEALPKNPNGKIQRRVLRETQEAAHGQT
ncbi:MAG: acyl--CoA ligase [Rhodobacteraceae bacterium]|nr:acyl--CoA ligase [Paracoccaceae bacterium]